MSKIKIVAEIGCNHNGDVGLAKEMIAIASRVGVDAVKFQSFVPENLVSYFAPKAEYQKINDTSNTQLDMLKKLALSDEEYVKLVSFANSLGIAMFSTPFDDISMNFLQSIGQSIWKVPSGEITNLPYLEKIAAIKCPNKEIILSTGMSNMEEIEKAIKILSNSQDTKFTILHCNTQYPTEPRDMNLRAMDTIHALAPEWLIGLSDHSEGIIAALVAVGLGAKFIEKHFTLDRAFPGPDHKASITPDELQELCKNIRTAELMLGTSEKEVTDSERENIIVVRKSIVAKRPIHKGEEFSEDNITCKRPGSGVSPMLWYSVIGSIAKRDYFKDELIELS